MAERRKSVYDWLQEVGIDTKGGEGEGEGERKGGVKNDMRFLVGQLGRQRCFLSLGIQGPKFSEGWTRKGEWENVAFDVLPGP